MSKLLKIIGVIALIGALGYVFMLVFVSPDFNNDKETLTTSFLENISEDDICSTHFNSETVALCTSFKDIIEDEAGLTYQVSVSGQDVVVTFTNPTDNNTVTYDFTFIANDNTGISAFFHKTIYYIDTIE